MSAAVASPPLSSRSHRWGAGHGDDLVAEHDFQRAVEGLADRRWHLSDLLECGHWRWTDVYPDGRR